MQRPCADNRKIKKWVFLQCRTALSATRHGTMALGRDVLMMACINQTGLAHDTVQLQMECELPQHSARAACRCLSADKSVAYQQVHCRVPKALMTWLFQPFHRQGIDTKYEVGPIQNARLKICSTRTRSLRQPVASCTLKDA